MKIAFIVLLIIILSIVIIVFIEENTYTKKYYKIQSSKLKKDIRICFISDLHGKEYFKKNNKLINDIVKNHPDIIIIAGDMIVFKEKKTIDNMHYFFNKLINKFYKGNIQSKRIFFINGNHEKRLLCKNNELTSYFKTVLSKTSNGIQYLVDDGCNIKINDTNLYIFGLDLGSEYYYRFNTKKIGDEVLDKFPKLDDNIFNILIAHHPDVFDESSKHGFDLTLSGHFHGGGIYLPFIGGIITPQFELFRKRVKGMFNKLGRKLIITTGLGGHKKTIRFNNKAEIVFINLMKE